MRLLLLQRLFGLLTVLLLPVTSFGQEAKTQVATEKTPTILFVCEHGAGEERDCRRVLR